MPPKQKGYNARGRQKIFRHAVENVSIGVGHTAIGNVSLQLAAGVSSSTNSAGEEQCAFYLELNQQLLSHSSKDFTRFRWEVLEWCETKSILLLHHREVAEALLKRLLDRSSGANSGKSSRANTEEDVKGSTLEGYEAYLRLTIAFARDLKVKFLPYFEVFQQAVQAGLYDKKGSVIANAEHLQYLYSVQAAWCREMLNYFDDPQNQRLTRRIIRLYVQHFRDSKEYVRRLSAELLSFLCRLCRPLVPVVVQEACRGVVEDYTAELKELEEKQQQPLEVESDTDNDADSSRNSEEEDEKVAEKKKHTRGKTDGEESSLLTHVTMSTEKDTSPGSVSVFSPINEYIQRDFLRFHPILQGLTFFVIQLFRGMPGTLSSSMEFFYAELLHHFCLRIPHTNEMMEESSPLAASARVAPHVPEILSSSPLAEREVQRESVGVIQQELCHLFPPSFATVAPHHIRLLWKETGTLALHQALASLLVETRKQSLKDIHEESSAESEEEWEEKEGEGASPFPSSATVDMPSHRLLAAVVQFFQPDMYHVHVLDGLLKASNHFLWRDEREDSLFQVVAQQLLTELKFFLLPIKGSSKQKMSVIRSPIPAARSVLCLCSAVLELLVPLCVSPYVTGEMDFGKRHSDTKTDRAMKVQQLFLKVGSAAVDLMSYFAFRLCSPSPVRSSFGGSTPSCPSESRGTPSNALLPESTASWHTDFFDAEAAQTALVAFAQDVLSKNYCFCVSEERRITDDDLFAPSPSKDADAKNDPAGSEQGGSGELSTSSCSSSERKKRVPSFLTPLALTLLRSIVMEWWTASLRVLGSEWEAENTASSAWTSLEVPVSPAYGDVKFHLSLEEKDFARSTEAILPEDVEWWVACRRLLERAILLLRLTSDTTTHSASTPLRQLLRLQPVSLGASSAKDTTSVRTRTSDSLPAMPLVLQQLFFAVTRWFAVVQETVAKVGSKERMQSSSTTNLHAGDASYLHFTMDVCESASEIFVCMLPLSDALFAASSLPLGKDTNGSFTQWGSLLLQIQHRTALESLGNIGYLVHAHISLHVLRMLRHSEKTFTAPQVSYTSDTSLTGGSSSSSEETTARFNSENLEVCIPQHLSQLIQLLHTAFEKASMPHLKRTTLVGEDRTEQRATLPSSEEERLQLYRAAEMMLEALRVGLFADGEEKNRKHSKACPSREKTPSHLVLLLPHPVLQRGLHLLKTYLSLAVQKQLSYLLLECLVSPLQSLRVSALQLLQILCDASLVMDGAYLQGLSAVDPFIFIALLAAECYNPLSHSGNMDGIRRALNPVVSAVERRAVVHPLSKIIVGRAMIGLYYLKFSEAWSIAQTVLVELFTSESVSHSEDGASRKKMATTLSFSAPHSTSPALDGEKGTPFWTDVVEKYGRMLALGGAATAVEGSRSSLVLAGKNNNVDVLNTAALSILEREKTDEYVRERLCSYRLYRIHLTDQQRHEKGEMISRAFSSVLYNASRYSVVDLPSADGEVLSWERHWRQVHLFPLTSLSSSKASAPAGIPNSTDTATVSKTFLTTLVAMAKQMTKSTDHRLFLVEELLEELSAVYHKEHPSGLPVMLKRVEERVELALQAYSNGPSLSALESDRHPLSANDQTKWRERKQQLINLSASFLAEDNGRLQRAAIDNLKHLKVEPFYTYHTKLAPFAENMKSLFTFLSTFHVEDEVIPKDRESFISTVLLIVLPKLTSKVSKEKRRDQAVLQRRIFSFFQQLPTDELGRSSKDALYAVVVRLLQHSIFGKAQEQETFPLEQLNFMRTWEEKIVQQGDGKRTVRHCSRFLELLHKRLLSSLRLLEALMGAVGVEFASCVKLTLTLALQAYLVACKQNVTAVIDRATQKVEIENMEGVPDGQQANSVSGTSVQRIHALTRIRQTLQGRSFATVTSHVRRSAVQLVATLMEQFPLEGMSAIETEIQASRSLREETLFGKYIHLLFHNSKGAARNKDQSEGWEGGIKKGAKVGVHSPPILRLVRSWLMGPSLLPLISCFGKEVAGTFQEVFAFRDHHRAEHPSLPHSRSLSVVGKEAVKDMYDALSCITDILRLSDEEVLLAGSARQTKKKGKGPLATLQTEFIHPFFPTIFESLYRLFLQSAESDESGLFSSSSTMKTSVTWQFPLPLWRELLRTLTSLSSLARQASFQEDQKSSFLQIGDMREKILEIAIRFASSSVCASDSSSLLVALDEMEKLVKSAEKLSVEKHYYPVVRLFNTVPFPTARLRLCDIFQALIRNVALHHPTPSPVATAQLDAVARAVKCLNSFDENNTVLERYDFDLRYHTFNSLQQFFSHDGNYKALSRTHRGSVGPMKTLSESSVAVVEEEEHTVKEKECASSCDSSYSREVRQVRDYSGAFDIQIPLERKTTENREEKVKENESDGPLRSSPLRVLIVEGLSVLAANAMFFLRDAENTIRNFSRHLLDAMIGYISRVKENEWFRECAFERVIRHTILPSLRRGVVARDVMIRGDHLSSFGALGKYFPDRFSSFAALYSANSEVNFFINVNHMQPKARLSALALLRRHAEEIQVRDLLRVFIPFLLSAVKDFAQGKRELHNLTEGKAKGYCDAVLMTIASISQKLPWMAYHRVLSLLLQNAKSNPDMRLPMLQGVVQVLEHFHFLDEGKELQKDDLTVDNREYLGDSDGEDDEDARAKEGKERPEGETNEDNHENTIQPEGNRMTRNQLAEGCKGESSFSAEDRTRYYHARIIQALEKDILPPLFEFIYDAKERRGLGVGSDPARGQLHTISAIRKEDEMKQQSAAKNTLLQLPVALAVTKIVKKLPEDRYHEYLNVLLDDIISKLRTKNDKQRQSARRILGVMLQETGPGKLQYVIRKLKGHLVHGYQLHVLGYTVVTLLYQLYEPHNILLRSEDKNRQEKMVSGKSSSSSHLSKSVKSGKDRDVISEALQLLELSGNTEREKEKKRFRAESDGSEGGDGAKKGKLDTERKPVVGVASSRLEQEEEAQNMVVSMAEEALLKELIPVSVWFDPAFGVQCLTEILDDVMSIFLDDYLGEVGHQKEQIELMSKMEEVKRNRSVQGFILLAKHAKADKVIPAFIQRMQWVLTPPSASEAQVHALSGSAYVRTIIKAEVEKKYTRVGKTGHTADIGFIRKVRELSLSVAKHFLFNTTLQVDEALKTVHSFLLRHNDIREERIRAFESKDGTRSIRGNAHLVIHSAPKHSLKEQFDRTFLVAPEPERVDVDFVAHTVLATQQKKKLKTYKGRYAKELQRASKDFYQEDPTTAVVLDTLDEFLLRLLLSMLRKVLGIGHDKGRHSVIELDLLRRHREKADASIRNPLPLHLTNDSTPVETSPRGLKTKDANVHQSDEDEDVEDDTLDPSSIQEEGNDALDAFAAAARDEIEVSFPDASSSKKKPHTKKKKSPSADSSAVTLLQDLTTAFTMEHHNLLQSLLTVVLTTLEGEGSDAVISHALDSVLALVSLRPPLDLGAEASQLLQLMAIYFERGGPIKQRALRLCAGIISHQHVTLSLADAKRMVLLIRAEVLDRTEYLPMALSLLYAILGTHVELEEIYDLVDLLTELLIHLSGKRVIRTRTILCLVRFMTEYKLTMSKFRSHVDLLCRNLDFPELSGRLALLDLLNALFIRLPTVILRQEAPVFLLPLASMASQGAFPMDRERSGGVLQALIRLAGLDVLAPIIVDWLDTSKEYSVRIMGMQTVALCMKALQEVYGNVERPEDEDEEEQDENSTVTEFQQSVEWCIPFLLEVCRTDPATNPQQAKTKKHGDKKKKKTKGWSLVFYALRSLECITQTAPQRMFSWLAADFVPHLMTKLLLHPHHWVRGVCFRLLNAYAYQFVEKKSHYLVDSFPTFDENSKGREHHERRPSEGLPLLFPPSHGLSLKDSGRTSYVTNVMKVIHDLASGIKRVLTLIGESDVDEKHQANAGIDHSARSELVKFVVYLVRAFQQCCLAFLVGDEMNSTAKNVVHKQYESLHRHMKAIATPILKQGSAANYVLRCASLAQFFSGYIGMLPREDNAHGVMHIGSDEIARRKDLYGEACQFLLSPQGTNILAFVTVVITPVLKVAVGARSLSYRLSEVGSHSLKVALDQLQKRQWYWEPVRCAPPEKKDFLCANDSRKRQREEVPEREQENPEVSSVTNVLTMLRVIESSNREVTHVKRIRKEVQKNLKRNRYEQGQR